MRKEARMLLRDFQKEVNALMDAMGEPSMDKTTRLTIGGLRDCSRIMRVAVDVEIKLRNRRSVDPNAAWWKEFDISRLYVLPRLSQEFSQIINDNPSLFETPEKDNRTLAKVRDFFLSR